MLHIGFFDVENQYLNERKDFNYFHFPVFEHDNDERNLKFEILAMTPYRFSVRMPEFDYIKSEVKACVEYNLDQLLCFLLAYDKKQCHEFMKCLWKQSGVDEEIVEAKLSKIPIFKEFYRESVVC